MTEVTEILPPDGALPAFPTDEDAAKAIVTEIAERARAHVPDLSTARSRGEIASLAHKIARTKTAMDAAGKEMVADAKKQIARVDGLRRLIRTDLDALKDEVRLPLTEWEAEQEKRAAEIDGRFRKIKVNGEVAHGASSETIASQIAHAEAWMEHATKDWFDDRAAEAEKLLTDQIAMLKTLHDNAVLREERDRELERLKAEEAAREAAEAEKRKAEVEAERRRQAELEEANRKVREAEEAKRRAEQEAEEAREREARAAEAERQRIEEERRLAEARAKAEAEEAERRKRAEAEAAQQRGKALAEAADAMERVMEETDPGTAEAWANALIEAIRDEAIPHVRFEVTL